MVGAIYGMEVPAPRCPVQAFNHRAVKEYFHEPEARKI